MNNMYDLVLPEPPPPEPKPPIPPDPPDPLPVPKPPYPGPRHLLSESSSYISQDKIHPE